MLDLMRKNTIITLDFLSLFRPALAIIIAMVLLCPAVRAKSVLMPTLKKGTALKPVYQGVLPLSSKDTSKLASVALSKGDVASNIVEYVDFTIPITDYTFIKMPRMANDIYLLMGKRANNFKLTKIPLEASLPFIVKTIPSPKNRECIGVKLVSAKYSTFPKNISLMPVNQQSTKVKPQKRELGAAPKVLMSKKYYNRAGCQPGSFVDFFNARGTGSARKVTYLRFFPVQYIPSEGEITALTQIKIALYYRELKSKT